MKQTKEVKEVKEKHEHKYNYAADIKAWEKLHGTKKFATNPDKIPNWMKNKNGEQI